MAQALESVPAKGALQNLAFFCAIKKRSPLLQFTDAVRSFLRVQLRHAPVVQQFSAAHGVAKMHFPIVRGIHVGHGRGDAAFGHYRVGFAKQRFANHAYRRALRQSFDRRAQSCAARADDQYIVFANLVICGHRILRSRITPLATSRMYKSAEPTEIKLAHANCMWRSFRKEKPRQAAARVVPKDAQEKQSILPPAK